MAGPIYKLWMAKPTEAFYQLSEEEQNSQMSKVGAALEQAGGREVVLCQSAWSSDQWPFFGLEEFPDIEAVQKHTALLDEINHFRYIESVSILGIPSAPS
jgi:hypothetical protein